MSSHCPWHDYALHRYSAGTECSMQHMYDDTYTHIFRNVLYSSDPTSGKPLVYALVGVDTVKLLEFGLNHRVCNAETTVQESEMHVLEFRPNNATELWTLMRNVYKKWENLYENNGRLYWPCKSQAADLIIGGDGVDTLRCLQPIRFVTNKYKLTQALLDLLLVLTTNYFYNLLEAHVGGDYLADISRQKVRKIECNAMNKAMAFYSTYDPDRFASVQKSTDPIGHSCSVKQLMDTVTKHDSPKASATFLRKLFHFTISDVFTGHREHVHMLLCHRFLVEDPVHCDSWLHLMVAVADSRLQLDDAQNRLTMEVKQWKRQYDFKERKRRAAKRRREEERWSRGDAGALFVRGVAESHDSSSR